MSALADSDARREVDRSRLHAEGDGTANSRPIDVSLSQVLACPGPGEADGVAAIAAVGHTHAVAARIDRLSGRRLAQRKTRLRLLRALFPLLDRHKGSFAARQHTVPKAVASDEQQLTDLGRKEEVRRVGGASAYDRALVGHALGRNVGVWWEVGWRWVAVLREQVQRGGPGGGALGGFDAHACGAVGNELVAKPHLHHVLARHAHGPPLQLDTPRAVDVVERLADLAFPGLPRGVDGRDGADGERRDRRRRLAHVAHVLDL